MFARLTNDADLPVRLVGARSGIAGMVEVHETVAGPSGPVMAPKAGGIQIPPGASVILAPGGNHVMLMNLARPLRAGDEVALTLLLRVEGQGTAELPVRAPVKAFTGEQERYHGHSHAGMTMSTTMPSGS
jgi:copper(I)-binding protein